MIPIHTVVGVLLVMFALIGSLRGWAKEVIVAFSVIVALFFEHVLLEFIPPVRSLFDNMAPHSQFYTRSIVFILITVFGYATPTIASKLGAKVARERLQDLLLGFFLGVLNGFLVVGTLLSFLTTAHYGVPDDMWGEERKLDESGQPVLDADGAPVMEVVYRQEARGIGGIVPPERGSTTANLSAFLPPVLIARSTAVLYLAVAAAFVFVIVVFI
jgi:uncharacterized membrane protein required for colicin V production